MLKTQKRPLSYVLWLSGSLSALYTAYTAKESGASTEGTILAALFSWGATTASISNLANYQGPSLSLGLNAFLDLVFGSGANLMAAGIYKTITQQPDMRAAAKAGVKSVTELKQRRIRSIAVYAALAVVTGVKETINENPSR